MCFFEAKNEERESKAGYFLPLLFRFFRLFTLTESLAQANPAMQPSIENKSYWASVLSITGGEVLLLEANRQLHIPSCLSTMLL